MLLDLGSWLAAIDLFFRRCARKEKFEDDPWGMEKEDTTR